MILYSCDASIVKTAIGAAGEFARSYWAEPRHVVNWDPDNATFQVRDGTRIYRVVYDPGVRFERIAVYRVEVQQ